MITIPSLLKDKTPFAVMQYFESLKSLKSQTNKVYELIYVNDKKRLGYKPLTKREIDFVKKNPKIMKVVIDTKDGRIYEYNDFKIYKEANVKFEVPVLTFSKKEITEYISLLDKEKRQYFNKQLSQFYRAKDRSEEFKNCLKFFNLTYEK